jgi:hypothetical protein
MPGIIKLTMRLACVLLVLIWSLPVLSDSDSGTVLVHPDDIQVIANFGHLRSNLGTIPSRKLQKFFHRVWKDFFAWKPEQAGNLVR